MSESKAAPKLPKQLMAKGGNDCEGICFRCGKPVAVTKASVLEQDGRIAEWHDFGMPEDVSDGPALFGNDCAAAMRKRARFDLGTLTTRCSDPDEPKIAYLARMKRHIEAYIADLKDPSKPSPLSADLREGSIKHYAFMLTVIDYQLSNHK